MPIINPLLPNTANLHLIVPDPGGSSDVWGDNLNTDLALIDAKFAPTGPHVIVQTNAQGYPEGTNLTLNDADKTFRMIWWETAGSVRWAFGASSDQDGIGNVGSDLMLFRYDNTGVDLDGGGPLVTVSRSTGVWTFNEKNPQVMVGGVAHDIVHTGNIFTSLGSLVEPVGTVKMYVGDGAAGDPPGGFYMLCDGRGLTIPVLPTDPFYALYQVIGTRFGSVSGHFQLPNTAARIIIGQAPAIPSVNWPPTYDVTTVGKAFGTGLHTLTIPEIPIHNHNLQDHGHSHNFGYNPASTPGGGAAAANFNAFGTQTGVGTAIAQNTTGITIDPIGGGLGHDNVPPSLVMQFIIRVK